MKKIFINCFSKTTAMLGNKIEINITDFANVDDAMSYAKFKEKQIDKKQYQTLITTNFK